MTSAGRNGEAGDGVPDRGRGCGVVLAEVSRLVTVDLSPYVREVLGTDFRGSGERVASASVR